MTEQAVGKPDVQFELSDHLPYLFKHIHSQLEVASAGQLAQFGINVAVWRILVVLWQHDDLSHRELAELTSIEVSTLSRISKSVQRNGFIRRKRTPQDQRTVRVTLTDKGRDVVVQVIPWALGIQTEMVDGLSSADVTNLIRILHVIVENLGRYAKADNLEGDVPVEPAAPRSTTQARLAPYPPSKALTRRNRAPIA